MSSDPMSSDPMEIALAAVAALNNSPINELPEPFDQRYANLYLLLEDFLIDAVAAGVTHEVLWGCITTDIDCVIANAS